MATAGAPSSRSTHSAAPGFGFRHNAHVVKGFDPLAVGTPEGSPGTDQLAAAHGSYAVRLEGVDGSTAELFLRTLGVVGGQAHTAAAGDLTDLVLFATLQQVEALRAQLLAAPGDLAALAEEVVAALHAYHRNDFAVRCGPHTLQCGARPLLMGVINCTPDSFYAGGRALGEAAAAVGEAMVAEGADLLDVGGESTRPDSIPVSAEEEIERVVPVIKELVRRVSVPISIDTTKAAVARAALETGATLVNDISGLSYDEELGEVVAQAGVPVILMHMRGRPGSMYEEAEYRNVVSDVVRELRQAMRRAIAAGISTEAILVDPGIGFAKRAPHSLIALRHLDAFRSLGRPLVVGPSRKSFIGAVLDLPPEERLEGTAAAVAASVLAGAHVIRVHDVGPMRRVAALAAAIRTEGVGWIS